MTTCSRADGCAGFNYPFLTQKERDNETGLDYFLARYYSSTQGRFTSPDEFKGGPQELVSFAQAASENPTFYAELEEPQSLNKYQYALNNPLRYVDPDGHQAMADALRLGATAGVAAEAVPGGQVVGTVILVATGAAAAGYVVYNNWDSIKSGVKAFGEYAKDHPGQSAMQQDLEDLRSLRNVNKPANSQQSQQGQSNTASPNPNDNDKKPFGASGTQTTSTTVGKGKSWRVDVENPNPGQRPGQIHYQSGNTKLLYDAKTNSFVGASKTQNRQLMNDPQVQRAIKKGLKVLGEN